MGTASAIRGHVSTGRRISSAWSAAGALSRWWAAVLAAIACGVVVDAVRDPGSPALHPAGAAALIAVVVASITLSEWRRGSSNRDTDPSGDSQFAPTRSHPS
jgi:hypothetical protein